MHRLLLTALLLAQASLPAHTGSGTLVRGRVSGLEAPSAVPVTLFGAAGTSLLQTTTHADGSFEFGAVPQGRYTLSAPGLTPVYVVVSDTDVNVDLAPLYSGPGVRVSGKVMGKSGKLSSGITRTVTLSPQMRPMAGLTIAGSFGVPTGSLETYIHPDGTFEFTAVPPGTYTLRTIPAVPSVDSMRLEVANEDIRGLQVKIPLQMEVTGHVRLEGRNIGPNVIIQATQGNFSTSTSILQDGTFRMQLTEGENQFSLAGLPPQFALKSIAYGSTDVTDAPLKIDSTSSPQEILVTLETLSPDRLPGVGVSGKAVGPGNRGIAGAPVFLRPLRPEGKTLVVSMKADGSFEFPKVPPGPYMLRIAAPAGMTASKIIVGETGIRGIRIRIPAEIQIAGKVNVVDVTGRSSMVLPANVSLTFRRAGGEYRSVNIQPDGTFRIPLSEGRYAASVASLPAGYALKSISSGSADLLNEPLDADTQHPPDDIEVVLEYKSR